VDVPEPNDSGQPSLELATDWFAKVVSPRDPGDLEGRHASEVLVVIEEADKAYITDEHFDSARSSVTDGDDRMLAVCNPPKDESNSVYERLEGDDWNTIQFSTLDSHNVRVDAGELNAEKIPGITDLDTIREDWGAYNSEPWLGLETARAISDPDSPDFRADLDERWYRRRAGVIPPKDAETYRPIERWAVKDAWERSFDASGYPDGTGIDVARSGDRTVMASVHGQTLPVHYDKQGKNHTLQEDRLRAILNEYTTHTIAVDAVGEGSKMADDLAVAYPDVHRFNAGATAATDDEYKDCWAEGLDRLGQWLENGGSIDHRKLREELLVAARVIEFEEKYYTSHGPNGAEVVVASPKELIKERLDRSPDYLDAAIQAVLAAEDQLPDDDDPSGTGTW